MLTRRLALVLAIVTLLAATIGAGEAQATWWCFARTADLLWMWR